MLSYFISILADNTMDIDFLFLQLGLFIIATVSNTISAIAGGGAGLIQLPALIFLGLPFTTALATHKLASVALGIGASLRHFREKSLDKELVLLIVLCGVPGVWLGAQMVLNIPESISVFALGILTFNLGIYSFKRPDLGTYSSAKYMTHLQIVFGGFVLFMIGFLNGFLSSGTGLFVTIWLVTWFRTSYPRAIAHTLILVGLLWNGAGALVVTLSTRFYISYLPALISGSLLGGYLGAHISITKGSNFVKKSFEIICFVIGISLIVKPFI